MRALVLNGSPAGDESITLFTVKYLEKLYPDVTFEVLHVGQRIRQYERDFAEAGEKLQAADLILFCYPVYTFLVPAQLHRFLELMKGSGLDLMGKYAAQITTSKHFYDVTAHRFIEDNCGDLGLRYLKGLPTWRICSPSRAGGRPGTSSPSCCGRWSEGTRRARLPKKRRPSCPSFPPRGRRLTFRGGYCIIKGKEGRGARAPAGEMNTITGCIEKVKNSVAPMIQMLLCIG